MRIARSSASPLPAPRRRSPQAIGRALGLAVVVLATGAALPATVGARSPIVGSYATDLTFHGRGWGHGVGMSQHGARGRALAGQTTSEILGHYYQGATTGTKDPATPVRVLVLTGFVASSTPATIAGRGGSWTIDGVEGKTFPADARLTLLGSTSYALKVTSAAGAVLHSASVTGSITVRPAATATILQLVSKPSTYDTYRGLLRVHLTTSVAVVNEVGLDTYLRGVVPVEMPASWPVEALKAQSIAARSYAARRLRPGVSTYDVFDDTRSQVYRGVEGEAAATNAAIAATAGTVLMSGSSIANTLFHSTGGGATEHNENVFVSASGEIVAGPVSYLRGAPDRAPDGTPYDAGAPLATWQTAPHSRAELSLMFGRDARTNVGSISRLDLSRRGVSGRLISVTLVGSAGTKTVSGDVFVSVYNAQRPSGEPALRSTLFDTRPIP